MSERYSRLFTSPVNLYAEGSPIIISAGALLKDNVTGKILVQLKFQNISNKIIKATTVKVTPLDTVGRLIGDDVEYSYLDLNITRDVFYGSKEAISLDNPIVRQFSVSVSEVAFDDNSVWSNNDAVWEQLKPLVNLNDAFDDAELIKQYRLEYGSECRFLAHEDKDLWYCTCGTLNRKSDTSCRNCSTSISVAKDFTLENLKDLTEVRLSAEKLEEKRLALVQKETRKIAEAEEFSEKDFTDEINSKINAIGDIVKKRKNKSRLQIMIGVVVALICLAAIIVISFFAIKNTNSEAQISFADASSEIAIIDEIMADAMGIEIGDADDAEYQEKVFDSMFGISGLLRLSGGYNDDADSSIYTCVYFTTSQYVNDDDFDAIIDYFSEYYSCSLKFSNEDYKSNGSLVGDYEDWGIWELSNNSTYQYLVVGRYEDDTVRMAWYSYYGDWPYVMIVK